MDYSDARRSGPYWYNPPRGTLGYPLSMDIRLYGDDLNDAAHVSGSWQWPISAGSSGTQSEPNQMLNITAARSWFDSSKQHRLDITCSSSLEKITTETEYPIKWLHVQRSVQDFDEFETIAMNMPEVSDNWKLVVSGLFKQLSDYVRVKGDRYLGPWLLRADGMKSNWTSEQDIPPSVTCLSFPCFETGPVQGHGERGTQDQYPVMNLYQWIDRTRAAGQWKFEESYPQLAGFGEAKDRIIYVPHVWCLVAGNVLLTYGPVAFHSLVGDTIQQMSPRPESRKGPTLVQITDIFGCTYEIDMRECCTYFELQHAIERRCFQNQSSSMQNVNILLPNGTVLTGESWIMAVETEESMTVQLSLSPKRLFLAENQGYRPSGRHAPPSPRPPPTSDFGNLSHAPHSVQGHQLPRRGGERLEIISPDRAPSAAGRNEYIGSTQSRLLRRTLASNITINNTTSKGRTHRLDYRHVGLIRSSPSPQRRGISRAPQVAVYNSTYVKDGPAPPRFPRKPRSLSLTSRENDLDTGIRVYPTPVVHESQPSSPETETMQHGYYRANSERQSLAQGAERDKLRKSSEAMALSRVATASNEDMVSDSSASYDSPEVEGTSRALVLYNGGDVGLISRPSFEYTEVTNIGYPTSLIISNPGRAQHIRLEGARKCEEQFDRKSLELAIRTLRSAKRLDLVRHETYEEKRPQRPGTIVLMDRANPLPSIYKPLEKEAAQATDESAQGHRIPGDESETRDDSPSTARRQNREGLHQKHPKQPNGTYSTSRSPKFNPKLKMWIPPFLSWATSNRPDTRNDKDRSRSEHIERILESVHITLREQANKSNRKLYAMSLELNRNELDNTYPFIKSLDADAARKEELPSEISAADRTEVKFEPAHFSVGEVDSDDVIHVELLKKCNETTKELLQSIEEFLSFYLPLTCKHAVAMKCWGAFETILSNIGKGLQNETKTREQAKPAFWVIRDASNDPNAAQNIEPVLSWHDCVWCRAGWIYRDYDDAIHHVKMKHFGAPSSTGKEPEISAHTLVCWLRNDHQYRTDQRLELYISYLSPALRHIRTILANAKYIREGTMSIQAPYTTRYMLPSSLVGSLKCTIMLLLLIARSVVIVSRYCNNFEGNQGKIEKEDEALIRLKYARNDLEAAGVVAVESIDRAKRDIMLMTYTDVNTGVVSYDAVGPEYILLTAMTNLFNRPLHGEEQVDKVYSSFVRKVYLDGKNHPRTRVVRRIWQLREELDLIVSVNTAQWEILTDFRAILDPSSFRVTTQSRANRFAMEHQFIAFAQHERHEIQNRIDDMNIRLENINTHVVQMLEIQQESNGNALIVFTLVTIIFLPLSWATLYLGMNTADVRDMNSGQWLYWMVAVPVTSVVIGLSLLVVLKGETIREIFIRRRSRIERKLAARQGAKKILSRLLTNASTYKPGKEEKQGWIRFRGRKVEGALPEP